MNISYVSSKAVKINSDMRNNLDFYNRRQDNINNYNEQIEANQKFIEEKNQEMKNNIASKIHFRISDSRFKQTLSDYEHEFTEQLSICQLFEKLSLSETEDMTITHDKRLQLLKKL